MKKYLFSLICIFLIVLVLYGCTKTDNINTEDTSKFNDLSANGNEIEFVTENQASFLMLVKDNPIDNELFKGPDSGNTQEMVNHYMKYATIWLEELHYSNDQLLPLLNNEDKTLFLSIQSQWEDNLKRENEFINDIFYGDKYDLNPGSIFSVETAYNYCQMIKERTLYVKYLHYCIEDTPNFIPKFLYTGEKSE